MDVQEQGAGGWEEEVKVDVEGRVKVNADKTSVYECKEAERR